MEEAAAQIADSLKAKKIAVESALKAVVAVGGDRVLEDSLRCRLREVAKEIHRSGGDVRTNLRAIALERSRKVKIARAESQAEEAREKELKLLVDLRTKEADIAKAKTKEAALAAKAALAEKQEAALLRAKAEEEDRVRRFGFAAFLARVANEYPEDKEKGEERRARCNRLALEQARRKAGTYKIDVPRFWSPTTAGLQQMDGPGALMRLRAKVEILWASSDFSWVLFGPPKEKGKEHMWDARYEPRYAFDKLLRKTMPGYPHVLSGRYGVDSLLAESYNILDLAYVGAQWRYTAVIKLK